MQASYYIWGLVYRAARSERLIKCFQTNLSLEQPHLGHSNSPHSHGGSAFTLTRRISMVSIVTEFLAAIMLHRLTPIRKKTPRRASQISSRWRLHRPDVYPSPVT